MSIRHAAAAVFLAAQGALVLAAQLGGGKSFAWAPHTTQIEYAIEATRNGQALTAREIRARYGLSDYGWEVHSIDNLTAIIAQHARTYGRHDDVQVAVRYRINGRPAAIWTWPPASGR